jgi:hypothetical protein
MRLMVLSVAGITMSAACSWVAPSADLYRTLLVMLTSTTPC